MRYDETLHNLLTDVGRPFIDHLREPGHQVVQEAWRTATLPDHRQHGRVSEKEERGPKYEDNAKSSPKLRSGPDQPITGSGCSYHGQMLRMDSEQQTGPDR